MIEIEKNQKKKKKQERKYNFALTIISYYLPISLFLTTMNNKCNLLTGVSYEF
jgi:hypothetical protein